MMRLGFGIQAIMRIEPHRLFLLSFALVFLTPNLTLAASKSVTASPSTLGFGSQAVGTTSAAQTATLSNGTTASVTVNSVVLPAGFVVAPSSDLCTGHVLAPAGKCTVGVEFAPTTWINYSGNLQFNDSAGSQTISLTGTTAVTLSPLSTTCGSVLEGSTGPCSSALTLTNNQSTAVTITSIAVSKNFTQTNNCPIYPSKTLASSKKCTINVSFGPQTTGAISGQLTVSDNAPNSASQTAAVSGTGMPTVAISPASWNFGSVAAGFKSAPQTFTIANKQSSALTISSIGTSLPFTWTNNNCPISPSTLAAGASCTVTVTFAPTAIGAQNGQLTVTDNAFGSPQSAALSGTGAPAVLSSITVSPNPGTVVVGATTPFKAQGTYSDGTQVDITASVTWSATPAAVATIDTSGNAKGITAGTATITAQQGTVSGTATMNVQSALLTKITLNPANPSIALGTNQQFTAMGTYADGSTKDVSTLVTWSSSTPSVASISNTSPNIGLATSLSQGTTTITAQLGSVSGTTVLTVSPAILVSIAVTPVNQSIPLGTTQQFVATGKFTDNTTQDITNSVTWSSDTPIIASISNSPGTYGLATAIGTGVVNITATQATISNSTKLTVTAAALVGITIAPADTSAAVGTTVTYSAMGTFTDGSSQDLTSSVTWSSTVPGVSNFQTAATPNVATALVAGTTTIKAVQGTITGSTSLSVTPAVLVSILISPQSVAIPVGTTQGFSASGTYSDGTQQDITANVHWSSTVPTVATVSNDGATAGLATTLTTGATSIVATLGSVSNSASLTVNPAALLSINVTPANSSIPLGLSSQFTAMGTYTDNTNADITAQVQWASSVISVAVISNAAGTNGLASSSGVGQTYISAQLGSVTGSTLLTVSPKQVVSLLVTPGNAVITAGTEQPFTVTATYSDNTTGDVTNSAQWSSSVPAIATIDGTGTASGLVSGSTTITAAIGSVQATASLNVVAAPVITSAASSASVITVGDSVQLQATFTGGIGVFDNGIGVVTSGIPVTVSPAATTTYTLTVTNAVGAIAQAQISVTVIPAPVITSFVASSSPITSGDISVVTGTFSGGSGTIDNGIGSVSNGVGVSVSPAATTTYTLTVTNAAGRSVQAQVTVNVVAVPAITSFIAGSASITPGGSTSLTAIFSGGSGSIDNGVGAVNSGIGVSISPAATTTYTLTVTNAAGKSVTAIAVVTVSGTTADNPGGQLNTARQYHSAHIISSGSVIVIGGVDYQGNTLDSAEVYSPSARTWTVLGATLQTARSHHAYVTLKDGRILLAGGSQGSTNLNSVEIYDPSAQQFSSTAPLFIPRSGATATLLNDGRVLVAGGTSDAGASNTAEIYDPASQTFSQPITMQCQRTGHTSTLLADGRVAVLGGDYCGTTVEIFDPTTNSFVIAPVLGSGRTGHTATLLPTGKLLVIGGASMPTGEVYDVVAGSISQFSLAAQHQWHTANALPDGRILVIGGYLAAQQIEAFVSTSSPVQLLTPLHLGRYSGHTSTLLSSGAVLVVGGYVAGSASDSTYVVQGTLAATAELYNPATSLAGTTTVQITPGSASIDVGSSQYYSATATFGDGSSEDVTPLAYWSSSNDTVAAMSGLGAYYAQGAEPGTATISAAIDGQSGTATLTVNGFSNSTSGIGNTVQVRYNHTATMLQNGNVLLAGGDSPYNVELNTAELYNATTQTFTLLPTMTQRRWSHSATLLANGKVLLAGGLLYSQYTSPSPMALQGSELFDPANNTFTAAANLHAARGSHTATLLNDGTVLIAGGLDPSSGMVLAAELYHPDTGLYEQLGNMATARWGHTATLLSDGTVLLAGGFGNGGTLNVAEIYNPTLKTFTPVSATMLNGHASHRAVLLANGKVLLVGGANAYTLPELYDPSTGTFEATGTESQQRLVVEATSLPDNTVLISGGNAVAEIYDPVRNSFRLAEPFGIGRTSHTATLLRAGSVLLAGGQGYNGGTHPGDFLVIGGLIATPEVYVPSTSSATLVVTPATATIGIGQTASFTATVTFSSGNTEDVTSIAQWTTSNAEIAFNYLSSYYGAEPGTVTASALVDGLSTGAPLIVTAPSTSSTGAPEMVDLRFRHTATKLSTGDVLLAGGANPFQISLGTAELYHPATNTYTAVGTMTTPRYYHTATLLTNGKVLFTGGINYDGTSQPYLSSAEIYDPATQTFTATGSMTEARAWHTATLLPDGRVLIVGGLGSNGYAGSEIYDPSAGVFTVGPTPLFQHYQHTATLLKDETVLLAGGTTAAAEVYDPVHNAFSSVGSMASFRVTHTATLLKDGRVLIAGGQNGSGITNEAETYDPSSRTFTVVGSMVEYRFGHTATLLPNGKVLVVGGSYTDTEMFDPATNSFAASANVGIARYYHTATLLNIGPVLLTGGGGPPSGLFSASYGGFDVVLGVIYTPELFDTGSTLNGLVVNATSSAVPPGCMQQNDPLAANQPLGCPQQFSALGQYSDGSTLDVSSSVEWSSSTPSVATINAYGVAQSLSQGDTTVTATTSGFNASATLHVNPPALYAIAVMPGFSLRTGQTQQMTATGSFTDHVARDVTPAAAWSVSDPLSGSVGTNGVFTAILSGRPLITATVGNVSGTTGALVDATYVYVTDYDTGELQQFAVSYGSGSYGSLLNVADLSIGKGLLHIAQYHYPYEYQYQYPYPYHYPYENLLAVTNYLSNTVSLFRINPDLGHGYLTRLSVAGTGSAPRMSAFAPNPMSGQPPLYLYVPNEGDNNIWSYRIASDWSMSVLQQIPWANNSAWPVSLTFNPLNYLYDYPTGDYQMTMYGGDLEDKWKQWWFDATTGDWLSELFSGFFQPPINVLAYTTDAAAAYAYSADSGNYVVMQVARSESCGYGLFGGGYGCNYSFSLSDGLAYPLGASDANCPAPTYTQPLYSFPADPGFSPGDGIVKTGAIATVGLTGADPNTQYGAGLPIASGPQWLFVARNFGCNLSQFAEGADGGLTLVRTISTGAVPSSIKIYPDPAQPGMYFMFVADQQSQDVRTYHLTLATGDVTLLSITKTDGNATSVVAY